MFSPPQPSPPPNLAPPPTHPWPTPKYAIVRKSDAQLNRHQKGAVPVVPGDQAPYHPYPLLSLLQKEIYQISLKWIMKNTYKSHPKRETI